MISVANLKAYLNLTGTEHDTVLTAIEVRSVALLEQWAGRYFGADSQAVTDLLSSDGGVSVWLSEPPKSGTLVISKRDATSEAWSVVTASDYEVIANTAPADPHGGCEVQRIDGDGWPQGYRLIKGVYTAGYAAGAEPYEIQQAVYDLVGHLFRHRAQATSAFADGAVPINPRFLPKTVWDAVQRWRRRESGWIGVSATWAS